MSDAFGTNLQLLCSHYRSIAEVCRRLAINRAQFNRYLSGQSLPTRHNLKRICDFFGVEDYELSQPPEQFAALIGSRAKDRPAARDPLQRLLQPLREHAGLQKDVVIAGVGTHIQIWDRARFEQEIARTQAKYREIAAVVSRSTN